MPHSLKYHIQAHFKKLPWKVFFFNALISLLITFLHWLSFNFQSNFWIGVTARLFYIPVILASIYGGLLIGTLTGFTSGLLHALLMFSLFQSKSIHHELFLSHIMETVALIFIGFLTGGLKDHEEYERKMREEITGLFDRYVSPVISKQIVENHIPLDGEEKLATVLFCDLADFTSLSERVPPKELLKILNQFFPHIVEILMSKNAFLDKFIGDATMAAFGIPFSSESDAALAVDASIEIQNKLLELNKTNSFGNNNLKVTIGMNSGNVIAGNVGSHKRISYTILGDAVNLASRIQSLNKLYMTNILITDNTLKLINNQRIFKYREIDSVRVKGKKNPTVIYDVYSADSEEMISMKDITLSDFLNGIFHYKMAEFDKAEKIFKKIHKNYPDKIIQIYLDRIRILKKNTPTDWDGVFDFTSK
ncbi:MAG TPA: adenylate/guanylate cyclase domain-containing protein [Leptospiraceae bacterium]|nr:adenylate/guanylate cyclase domain-containing protein [Leptospiraceae bacterium]HMW03651.1 adenylate/guanylate cyclase domain-containing protein [Leptospiraceae bacterium]HMX31222.1 adenylate/guanylate cyclase domain-containing protein [Leptospiraceae bacterium]HMY29428.1 adenylate/guanylate cyclase domain-containing protein [Leptospiraceae bacterium]HMZ65838.1 adenylate/guanylate cyclase domain-containing protein [Leptospiraceae bacterium]